MFYWSSFSSSIDSIKLFMDFIINFAYIFTTIGLNAIIIIITIASTIPNAILNVKPINSIINFTTFLL